MADAPQRGSNSDASETALLEALWRGDELEAVLRKARADLATIRQRLGEAEARIAELVLLGDAAQAAIDSLRAGLRQSEGEANQFRAEREALAAELFKLAKRSGDHHRRFSWAWGLAARLRARWS